MDLRVSFHFHAYQPGDVVLRRPGSPMSPPEYVERRSPVTLQMDEQDIKGDNWTDAMLRFYGEIWRLFSDMAPGPEAPFCSVDVEPNTLQLLAQKQPASFQAFRELVRGGAVDPVATVPFHILLPHVEPAEQRFLSSLTFRLHKGAFGNVAPASGALGFWFPENLYSEKASRAVVQSFVEFKLGERRNNGAGGRMLFYVLDNGQFMGLQLPQAALSANFMVIDTEKVAVFGRDRQFSDRWAFKHGTISELVRDVQSSRSDGLKEDRGVPYDLTFASDLESLAGSADQGARFRQLQKQFAAAGVDMMCHSAFLERKLDKRYALWDGELESKPFMVRLRDFSSWSDYMDQGVDYPSDTRWTGLHRWDGLVISRRYRRRPLSQIWKQGLWKVQNRVSRLVAKGAYDAIDRCLPPGNPGNRTMTEKFLLDYSGVVFSPLLTASGSDGAVTEYRRILDTALPGCRQDGEAALAARAYYEMLMANRSCPRFWDHLDTRVTFQSIVFLAHSLLDLAEVCGRLGLTEREREAERLYLSNLVNFHEAYRYYNLNNLFGAFGWEVSEDAWHMALASEVPASSGYDVVKRAALFVATHERTEHAWHVLAEVGFDPGQVVADCGHIEGELHGRWENMERCENRNIS